MRFDGLRLKRDISKRHLKIHNEARAGQTDSWDICPMLLRCLCFCPPWTNPAVVLHVNTGSVSVTQHCAKCAQIVRKMAHTC